MNLESFGGTFTVTSLGTAYASLKKNELNKITEKIIIKQVRKISIEFIELGIVLMYLSFVQYIDYDSQPIPSLSLSNPCGSEPTTLKFLYEISPQSKSGGYGGMQTSG